MRREIFLSGTWGGGPTPTDWCAQVRASGRLSNAREEWIPDPMYYYQENTSDTFGTHRAPFPAPYPEIPNYPWLADISSKGVLQCPD